MQFSSPSTILITAHDGTRTRARCLPCAARRDFLALWEAAWEKIKTSVLAQSAMEQGHHRGVAHLWDSDEEFKGLCLEMLALHGLDGGSLDISQVTELLFKSGDGNGLLVEIQFPPLPPGSSSTGADDSDPYHKLMAAIAFKSGDWASAQRAMETIPYDDVVLLCNELEKTYKEAESGTKRKAPPPPKPPTGADEDDGFKKVEAIALRDIEARMKGGLGMMAIQEALQERNNRAASVQPESGDGSSAPDPD